MDNDKVKKYSVLSNFKFIAKAFNEFDKSIYFYLSVPAISRIGLSVLGIYIPKIIIDCLTAQTAIETLILIICLVAIALIFLESLYLFSSGRVSAKAMSNRIYMLSYIISKTLHTDYENIANKNGQDMRRKAQQSLESNAEGAEALVMQLMGFLMNGGGLLIYGAILAGMNVYILVLLVIGAAINFIASRGAVKFRHKHKDDYVPIDNKLYYIREQTADVSNAKDIRVYSMAEWLINLFKTFINERHIWNKKIQLKEFFANSIDSIIILLRDGAAYAYLIYRVLNGLAVGDFVLYLGAVTGFSVWLSGISKNIIEIKRHSLHINDLRDYLDMPEKANHSKGEALPFANELPCSIELKNVYYKYTGNDDYTLENFNLHIKSGEKLAIVGVNGAGKTTIVKLICGLIYPDSGQILINGKEMDKYNIEEYRSLFSIAFQDACIMSFSLEENITMKPINKGDKQKLQSTINESGLSNKVNALKEKEQTYINNIFTDKGIELSGGERQKLILARALYKDAPVLILDEPTAALDPIAESELYKKYSNMAQNKTSVYISHRLASTRFCDRIIFLNNGQITEEGNHKELMDSNGDYAHMFEVQSHYYKNKVEENVL